jgi:hypothetical protein|tara:strand:- start:983 stop:1390 length:408 start_codon:yes stop_codon:yes gene_type:complete
MRPDDKRRLNKGNPILQKGVVLNPKGRPVGSVNKFTALSRELMSTKGPEIVKKVISMALEGDRTCLKMCMDRILPTTKAVELRSQEGKGNVIINVGGLTEKIIEEDKKKPLDYEEGVIISEEDEDEALVKLGTNG